VTAIIEEIAEAISGGPTTKAVLVPGSPKPAAFFPEEFRQPADAAGVSAWRIVNGERAADRR